MEKIFQESNGNVFSSKLFPSVQNFTGYPDLKSYTNDPKKGQILNFKYTDSIKSGGQIYSQQYQPQNYYTSIEPPNFANDIWKR